MHDVVDQVATFCRLMGRRREMAVRDRLRRPRLGLAADAQAKALVYKAPMGYGKSVQIAMAAEDAEAAHKAVAYVSVRRLPQQGFSSTNSLAAAILFQIAGDEQLRRAADSGSILPMLRETLLAPPRSTVICLDDFGDDPEMGVFVKDLICETSDLVKFVLVPSNGGGLTDLVLLPNVRTFSAQDLAFNEIEARAAVLPRAQLIDIESYVSLTGGWPALCGFMRETAVPSRPAWMWPETRNYFLEVLRARLSHDERTFLRNASMLESISAESYDYVFKTSNAADLISRLESFHALLTPARGDDSSYEQKIQPVLRAFLRDVFSNEENNRRSYVLKRVAFWHWRRREFAHAISAALEAHDHRWAYSLSKDVVLDLALRQGEIDALHRWFEKVPGAAVRRLPALKLGYAWTQYFSQKAEEAETVLEHQPQALRKGQAAEDGLGWSELVLAIGKATHDEMALSEGLCHQWIAAFGRQNEVGLGAALTCLAFIAASDRNFGKLSQLLQVAAATNRSVRQHYASGWLATAQIQAAIFRGEMTNARAILAKARANSDVSASRSFFVDGLLRALEFQILAESDPDELGEGGGQAALEFALDYGVTDILWGVVRAYSLRLYLKGEATEAQAVLQKCRALARARRLPRLRVLADLTLVELAAFAGDTGTQFEFGEFDNLPFLPNQTKAIQARVAMLRSMCEFRRRRYGLAERHAKTSMHLAASINDTQGEISAQYCLAAAMHAIGANSAKRELAEADHIARHLSLYATPRWMKIRLSALDPSMEAFFDREVTISPALGNEDRKPRSNTDVNINTSLSLKQIVVLQCLGRGMSNREIAERLFVTEDTVKWHLRQIFKEFGATNRTEAVIEAQSRGLI